MINVEGGHRYTLAPRRWPSFYAEVNKEPDHADKTRCRHRPAARCCGTTAYRELISTHHQCKTQQAEALNSVVSHGAVTSTVAVHWW